MGIMVALALVQAFFRSALPPADPVAGGPARRPARDLGAADVLEPGPDQERGE